MNSYSNLKQKIHWGESYTSLILGIIVVVVAALLVISFSRNRNTGEVSSTKTVIDETKESSKPPSKIHMVESGENLWSISERIYKSGYHWVDIAKANNLSDPGLIHVGNKLTLPDISPSVSAISQSLTLATSEIQKGTISSTEYTVIEGDNLWDISVRAYGDGYKWVELARVNNLEDPDLIFSGNKFKIPRSP